MPPAISGAKPGDGLGPQPRAGPQVDVGGQARRLVDVAENSRPSLGGVVLELGCVVGFSQPGGEAGQQVGGGREDGGEQHVADLEATGFAQQPRVVPGPLASSTSHRYRSYSRSVGRCAGVRHVRLVPAGVGGQAGADHDVARRARPSGASCPCRDSQPWNSVISPVDLSVRSRARNRCQASSLGYRCAAQPRVSSSSRPPAGRRDRQDPVHRDRVHRRVDDPACRGRGRGVLV